MCVGVSAHISRTFLDHGISQLELTGRSESDLIYNARNRDEIKAKSSVPKSVVGDTFLSLVSDELGTLHIVKKQ